MKYPNALATILDSQSAKQTTHHYVYKMVRGAVKASF
jgi:hypothetical protein